MKPENPDKISFEEALAELEDIAEKLAEGDAGLDESIKLFERGTRLRKLCSEKLDSASKKIRILTEESGALREEDFDVC